MTIEELIEKYKAGIRDFSGQRVSFSSTVYDVDLSGINLQGARLTEARFTDVKLDHANLQGAILSKAELRSVSLQGADLRGANFLGANLQNVDFTDAVYNRKTQFPRGFDTGSHGLVNDDAPLPEVAEKPPKPHQPEQKSQDASEQELVSEKPEVVKVNTQASSPTQPLTVSKTETAVPQKPQKDPQSLVVLFLLIFSSVLTAGITSILINRDFTVQSPPSPEPTTQSPPQPVQPPSLTQEEAMGLLNRWFQAKPQIFGPDYNLEPAYELLTGSLLEDVVSESVPWLRNNDAYYIYQDYGVEALEFSAGNGVATLTVNVYEVFTFYWAGRSPKWDSTNNPYTYTIVYDENSQSWKISDVRKNK